MKRKKILIPCKLCGKPQIMGHHKNRFHLMKHKKMTRMLWGLRTLSRGIRDFGNACGRAAESTRKLRSSLKRLER